MLAQPIVWFIVDRSSIHCERRSFSICQIDEEYHRGVADRCILAGESKFACLLIDLEYDHMVRALVATIEEPAARIERKATRIIAARPFFPYVRQLSLSADGEDTDAVVQSITCVDETSVVGE
jgi:hypothetical protein